MEPQVGKLADFGADTPIGRPVKDAASRIKILIDARKLGDGGIGTYTDNLIAGLVANPAAKVSIVSTRERASACSWFGEVEMIEDHARPYSLDEMFRLARRVPFSEFDVFHSPHYTLPVGVGIPSIITLHDLIHISHPEKRYYPLVAGSLIRWAVSRATRVITVSNATFEDLGRFSGRRDRLAAKVRVVPNALDPCFLPRADSLDHLSSRFHIRGRYLLAVCSMLKPHKGLIDLLQAFSALLQYAKCNPSDDELHRQVADLKLVLVGQGIERMVETGKLLDLAGGVRGVHILGSVSKHELASLYAGALALVVPSRAEGFCLPVIEAHAMGTPVIARPVPAVKELLCEGDEICADFSIDALRDGMIRFLGRERAERRAPDLGSSRYSRDDIARTILQVYREAIDEHSGSA